MQPSIPGALTSAAATTGFGLIALIGLFAASGLLPDQRAFAVAGLAPGLAGAACGLAPHGAAADWRSRRRLLTWATLAAAGAFLFGWGALGDNDGVWRWFGLFGASFALVASYCGAMAEAAPTAPGVRRSTMAALAPALLAGALSLNALVHLFGRPNPEIAMLAVIAAFVGFYVRRRAWRRIDTAKGDLPDLPIRRHRRTVFLCLFAFPLLLTLIGMGKIGWFAAACATLAALSGGGGLVAERWLSGVETPPDQVT